VRIATGSAYHRAGCCRQSENVYGNSSVVFVTSRDTIWPRWFGALLDMSTALHLTYTDIQKLRSYHLIAIGTTMRRGAHTCRCRRPRTDCGALVQIWKAQMVRHNCYPKSLPIGEKSSQTGSMRKSSHLPSGRDLQRMSLTNSTACHTSFNTNNRKDCVRVETNIWECSSFVPKNIGYDPEAQASNL
jgi:hypothetical protein